MTYIFKSIKPVNGIITLPQGVFSGGIPKSLVPVGTKIVGNNSRFIGDTKSHVLDWQNIPQNANIELSGIVVDPIGYRTGDNDMNALKLRDGSFVTIRDTILFGSDWGNICIIKLVTDVLFENVTFVNCFGNDLCNMFYARQSKNITLKNCTFCGYNQGNSLQAAGVQNLVIDGCTFIAPLNVDGRGRNEGVYLWMDVETSQNTSAIIRNTVFKGYKTHAITIRNATKVLITGNRFENNNVAISARDLPASSMTDLKNYKDIIVDDTNQFFNNTKNVEGVPNYSPA